MGLGEAITGKVKPQVSINPTVLFNNGAANISTNLAGASAAVRAPLVLTENFPELYTLSHLEA